MLAFIQPRHAQGTKKSLQAAALKRLALSVVAGVIVCGCFYVVFLVLLLNF